MLEGDEITQQDANTEESSAPQTEVSNSESEPAQAQSEAGQESQSERQTPFHEHPRFKELIEYRRESEQRLAAYEQQMQEMQRQYQEALKAREPQKEVNPFVAKLKEIDPAYAQWAETVEGKAAMAEQLKAELDEIKKERVRSQYENAVEKLHSEHKVPDDLKGRIRREIDFIAMTNPKLGMQDLPRVYKQVFDDYSKFVDNLKRAERASYVTDKTKDASVPAAQPKTKSSPSRNEKGQFTGDKETDLALIAKRALKMTKAESDL